MVGEVVICVYGLVLIAITYGLLHTGEFTKWQLIFLIIAWVPFVVFGIAMVATIGTLSGGGNVFGFLWTWLIVSSPLLAIIGIIVLVMWLMARWRG